MVGLYVKKFVEEGFLVFVFDFCNFGESGGELCFYESFVLKV